MNKLLVSTIFFLSVFSLILLFRPSPANALWCSPDGAEAGHRETCNGAYDCGCNCSAGREQQGCTSGTVTTIVCSLCQSCTSPEPYCCSYTENYSIGQYCYNLSASCSCCTDCTPPACAPTYSTSNLGFGSTTTSCSNSCGTRTNTCYCQSACIPEACPTGYIQAGEPGASTTTYTTKTCNNDCGVTSTRTCNYYNCNECTLSCPAPLLNPGSQGANDPVLTNYATCSHSSPCVGPAKFGNCYEPYDAEHTTGSVTLSPSGNVLGFSSTTTSGIQLNNPLSVSTTFTDADGSGDIEAMSVWFRAQSLGTGTISTPTYIDLDNSQHLSPLSGSDNSWGFMMHKEGTTWVPYVVHIDGVNDRWVPAVAVGGAFNIPSATGLSLVQVTNLTVTDSGLNSKRLNFSLNFTPSGAKRVSNTTYNIYSMGLDTYSFTPYDNYPASVTRISNYWNPEQIRSPRTWVDTTRDWRIDLQEPVANSFTSTVNTSGQFVLNWNLTDSGGSNIAHKVVTLYASNDLYNSASPVTFNVAGTNRNLSLIPTDFSNTGNITSGYSYLQSSTATTGTITATPIADYTVGTVYFYLTVIDNAGNYVRTSGNSDLSDWIMTMGDSFYSSQGINFNPRNISDNTVWQGTQLAAYSPNRADVSTEFFGQDYTGNSPLIHTSAGENKSYFSNSYVVDNSLTSIYESYVESFRYRLPGLDFSSITNPATLSGNLSSKCDASKTCYADVASMTVSSGFSCDGNAIIFVSGNLTINPDVNAPNANRNACVFIVGGDVLITAGSTSAVKYNVLDAYILADGNITINRNSNKGLIVNGGLSSFNGSITTRRHMSLSDRNLFPSLAIIAHPKYGFIAKSAIGTPTFLVNAEAGFKP